MRSFFKAFFFLATFCIVSIQVYSQTQGTRPNIIVILADDLGYADVGFNRDATFPSERGAIPTPNIDALANSGVILKNAHVVHPFCGPSRVALLTGIYPHRIGAQYNLPNDITTTLGIPENETYFSKVLQDSNYNTSAIGKWHLGFENGKYQPLDRGFDHFFGFLGGGKNYFESIYEDSFYSRLGGANPVTNEYQDPLQRNRDYVAQNEYSNAANEDYLTDVLTDNAIQYIAANKGDVNPFFMYLAYNAPHTPLQATDAEIAAFKVANPNFENNLRTSSYLINSDPVTKLATQAEKDAKIEEFVEARIIYATMTVNMDNNIGRVVTELKKNINDFNNTVIIFLSDNGGYRWSKGADNFPLDQQKGSVLEGGHKVPMFVSWPNQITTPSTYNYQVSSLDIYPTVANLAGATIPSTKKIDGLDFMDKIIAGQKVRADNKPLYAVRPQDGFHNGGIVSYPWKIVKTGNNGVWKLYNILNDPGESTDVRSSEANAEQIISDLLDESESFFYDFKDVKPAWFDNDGDGSGHPHSAEWNDGTLPNYVGLFERSFVKNDNFPLSDQQNAGSWALNTEISDEFDAVSLDEDKWLIQGRNGEYQSNFIGRSPAQFSTDNAILENGKLKIVTKWEPSFTFTNDAQGNMLGVYEGVSKPITTAAVISKKQFKYGYMEIKSKAANAEVTSSFWTTGPGPGLPGASELDMFEMFGGHKTNADWKKRLKFNVISWDPTNSIHIAQKALGKIGTTHTRNIQAANNTADDFHVYGFDWTEDYIKVYIDGVLHPEGTILKSVITNNGAEPDRWVTDVPYWIWFDSETFPWLGLPDASDLSTPAEYQIEYIRVWEKQIITDSKPTLLTPGDAAIVGYKAAAGNVGEVSFLIFKDINIGTSISFSNRSWHDDGSFNEGGSGPYGIDDVFSWTTTEAHTAGTIFKLGSNGKVTTVIGGVETEVGTTIQTFGSDGDWDLSPAGDTVLMYNGDSNVHPTDNSSLWITGLNIDGKSTAAGWATGGGNSYCQLPNSLTGYNIDVTGGDFNLNLWDINHGVYTGGVTGNPVTMRASIHNYANWTLHETNAYYLWDNDDSVGANNGNIVLGTLTPLSSSTDGVWENSNTWGGTMPSSGDTKTINSNITINSHVISNGEITLSSGNLTVKTGSSLTLNGDLTTNDALILEAGAQIIVKGAASGKAKYERILTGTSDGATANKEGWFSVSPPVSGEALNTAWADANSLATGTGGNRGLATYTESNNNWAYFNGTATTFTAGKGYIVKRTTDGKITFEGTVNTLDTGVDVPVTKDGTGFNLLGNPYTSIISSVTFIAENTLDLEKQEIYVWNDNGNTYNTFNNSSDFDLAPGQAFFVQVNKATNLNFSEANQETSLTDSFQKSTRSKIKLTIENGKTHRYAEVYYLENGTKGYDEGYDGEVFGGVSENFSLYTHILEHNQGKNYQIQTLPNSDLETMVIPVGLKLDENAEIIFKLETINISAGLKVFLEDRQENTFTQLDVIDAEYKITLDKSSNEVGRFYIHTSKKSTLSTEDIQLQGIGIYKSAPSRLKITGLKAGESTLSIVNLLGKKITSSSFNATNGNKEIQLPNIKSGVYFVQLITSEGKLIKKIIL